MRIRKSATEYFRTLGLQPGASAEEVRRAYLRLVRQWHPDRFAHDSRSQFIAQEKLKEINEAYSFVRGYKPGQVYTDYWDEYSRPVARPQGPTAQWREYQRWARYAPPVEDPYAGDYQYRPVGESRGSRFGWLWIVCAIFISFVANVPPVSDFAGSAEKGPSVKSAQYLPGPENASYQADGETAAGAKPQQLPYFFVGSSKADVYRVQGMPDWADDHEWRYGDSRVYFRNAIVERWEKRGDAPLKAVNLPTLKPGSCISLGSSTGEVLAIQGAPNALKDTYWAYPNDNVVKTTYWKYGDSDIEFSEGKVVSWTEKPGSPLKVNRLGVAAKP